MTTAPWLRGEGDALNARRWEDSSRGNIFDGRAAGKTVDGWDKCRARASVVCGFGN